MPEWWTYTAGDFLMYSPRIHARLVEAYLREIWPAQALALAAGVAVAVVVPSRAAWRGRATAALLAAGWGFVAWAYFAQRYATIDWAGTYFAYAFAGQALLLFAFGVLRGAVVPDVRRGAAARAAYALLLFALFVQPLFGAWSAGRWPAAPLAGLLPDPTAVATLGFVLAGGGPVRWPLLAIPLLWCAVSGVLLWAMESPAAFVMLGAGAIALALAVARQRLDRVR